MLSKMTQNPQMKKAAIGKDKHHIGFTGGKVIRRDDTSEKD